MAKSTIWRQYNHSVREVFGETLDMVVDVRL